MKKNILIIILVISTYCSSQINTKIIEHFPMTNHVEILDINGPSALGGDDVIWSEDYNDNTTPNVITQDLGGYGDWKWSNQSPGGQWSENTGIIESETPENGFMLMEADFYNTGPQNGIPEDGTVGENPINANFTIGPIDLSASETFL